MMAQSLSHEHRRFSFQLKYIVANMATKKKSYSLCFFLSPSANNKTKTLERLGKGNRPNRAQSYRDDGELLWEKGILGLRSPAALMATLWCFSLWLWVARPAGPARMRWNNLKLNNENGEEYLENNERLTKHAIVTAPREDQAEVCTKPLGVSKLGVHRIVDFTIRPDTG